MKAKVFVTLKPGILDPQGKAIQHSVELLGFDRIADVRQGKYFEIALDSSLAEDEARRTLRGWLPRCFPINHRRLSRGD
jgi:phosphoribosylformylglycinamidine synthase